MTTRVGLALALALTCHVPACLQPECSRPDYTRAECRVIVENEVARLSTFDGVELRFQDPDAPDPETWAALGVLEQIGPQLVRARVAAPGPFALSIVPGPRAASTLDLRLENVDPRARIIYERDGVVTDIPRPAVPVSQREVTLTLPSEGVGWVRGEPVCGDQVRIAALGDIQTNPQQFERIVEDLRHQVALDDTRAEAGVPGAALRALLIVGDLTERSQDEEFELVAQLADRVPVPVAVTPGNHDVYAAARAIYNRLFGPGNYAFTFCGTHVVMLDTGNGALAPSIQGRLPELFTPSRRAGAWIVATHYPAYPELTGNGWSREDQAQDLLLEAALAQVDLLLAGHIHTLMEFAQVPVMGTTLRQIVVGTGGANQGVAPARYGYLDITTDGNFGVTATCFREVVPPNWGPWRNPPLSPNVPNCPEPEPPPDDPGAGTPSGGTGG